MKKATPLPLWTLCFNSYTGILHSLFAVIVPRFRGTPVLNFFYNRFLVIDGTTELSVGQSFACAEDVVHISHILRSCTRRISLIQTSYVFKEAIWNSTPRLFLVARCSKSSFFWVKYAELWCQIAWSTEHATSSQAWSLLANKGVWDARLGPSKGAGNCGVKIRGRDLMLWCHRICRICRICLSSRNNDCTSTTFKEGQSVVTHDSGDWTMVSLYFDDVSKLGLWRYLE